jgi:hypothetical protein
VDEVARFWFKQAQSGNRSLLGDNRGARDDCWLSRVDAELVKSLNFALIANCEREEAGKKERKKQSTSLELTATMQSFFCRSVIGSTSRRTILARTTRQQQPVIYRLSGSPRFASTSAASSSTSESKQVPASSQPTTSPDKQHDPLSYALSIPHPLPHPSFRD